jgi:hypothetical protein
MIVVSYDLYFATTRPSSKIDLSSCAEIIDFILRLALLQNTHGNKKKLLKKMESTRRRSSVSRTGAATCPTCVIVKERLSMVEQASCMMLVFEN